MINLLGQFFLIIAGLLLLYGVLDLVLCRINLFGKCQINECSEDIERRLSGPLPDRTQETTNVCRLRLVDPPEEPDPQEESMIEAMEGDDA